MPAGFVIVDKPAEWTSHDVVARIRRLAGTRKVGHGGTLDPLATGVLVVGVSRATRLLRFVQDIDKEYVGTVRLGQSTVTDDAGGEAIDTLDASHLEPADVDHAITSWTGSINQTPSSVSAVKVAGRRAYDRVRHGEDTNLQPRHVTVWQFERQAVTYTGTFIDLNVRVVCSSGTYVRALARDIGQQLGVGGHLTSLRRTRIGPFGIDSARSLEDLAERFEITDMNQAARAVFPRVLLDAENSNRVRHGMSIPAVHMPSAEPVAVFDTEGEFLAVYQHDGTVAKALCVFS